MEGYAMQTNFHQTHELADALPHGIPLQVMAGIENAAFDVLRRHGSDAFHAPLDAALAHETGHAVVATHEGFTIRQVTVGSRSVPGLGLVWGGRCAEAGGAWTTGPDSSVDEDLRRARVIIGGLAGETVTGLDRPGSSLDELMNWSAATSRRSSLIPR
jgi:hypothetical protein